MTTLDDVRGAIDALDRQIMPLLAQRLALADHIVTIKDRLGVSAAAPSRVEAVLENVRELAEAHGFAPEIAEEMWRAMIAGIVAREEKTLGTEGRDE
ncbi:chorismate mutase [Pseudoprimorskyibacter insulae]|nr:chorismate mutase [Pseudoprimorskyibacter insulae]